LEEKNFVPTGGVKGPSVRAPGKKVRKGAGGNYPGGNADRSYGVDV